MNRGMKVNLLVGCIIVLLAFSEMQAATVYARNDGEWDHLNSWSTVGIGGASCSCVPGANDDVIIDGYNLIIDDNTGNVTVNSLTILSDPRNDHSELRILNGMTLTITSDLNIEGKSNASDQVLLVLKNGTINVNGDFIFDQYTSAPLDLNLNISDRFISEDATISTIFIDPDPFLKTITVVNNGGKQISENKLFNSTGELIGNYSNSTNISTSDILSGVYYLKSFDANGNILYTSKLVIQ